MPYYHSTTERLVLDSRPISATSERDVSLQYLRGRDGYTYEVTIPRGLRLADDSDVSCIARELDPETPYSSAWEQVEEIPGVLDELVSQGYDGVEIQDMTPDNATEHRTITIFDPIASGIEIAEDTQED